MKKHLVVAMASTLLCAAFLYSEKSEQTVVINKAIAGTWKLVSTEEKLRNGKTRPYPDLGEKAQGVLMYSEDGHMCAALMNPARPRWTHDPEHATEAESLSAASGYTCYCGKYRVDEKAHVIFHYPEISLYPNYIGTEQKRPYRFEGARMIFSDTVAEGEVERWTIVWEKARPQ